MKCVTLRFSNLEQEVKYKDIIFEAAAELLKITKLEQKHCMVCGKVP